jgi:hypothetical protein
MMSGKGVSKCVRTSLAHYQWPTRGLDIASLVNVWAIVFMLLQKSDIRVSCCDSYSASEGRLGLVAAGILGM